MIKTTQETTTASALNWRKVKIHFGKKRGTELGDLTSRDLEWWKSNWFPNPRFCKAPKQCIDCDLRAALDAAEITPEPERLAPIPASLECEFKVGDKVKKQVRVDKISQWETEFNRKKVVQYGAYFRNGGDNLFYWKSSSMPDEVKEGAEFEIEGTVKDVFIPQHTPERCIALQRCKISGVLEPQAFIVLFCDAKSSADRIAVCDEQGEPLFAGTAGLGRPENGDNTDHELAAAIKALELANSTKELAGLKCIAVELRFDAEWMRGMVGKAKPIRDFAREHGLKVTMVHISGESNPADQWTVGGGEISKAATLKK